VACGIRCIRHTGDGKFRLVEKLWLCRGSVMFLLSLERQAALRLTLSEQPRTEHQGKGKAIDGRGT